MVRFEELQELWQKQGAGAAANFDARGLAAQLRRFGRWQMWINLCKVVVMAATLEPLIRGRSPAPLVIAGVALLYSGMAIYLVLDWRNQIGLSRLDFSAPSVEFVRGARARLQHQLNPMRRTFWLLVATCGGGLNLMMLAAPRRPLSVQIARHLFATAMPFGAYVLGARIRKFRFRRECGAVLERLDSLVRTMEEHAE